MEPTIQPVMEAPVQRAVRPAAESTPQFAQLQTTTTTTTTTDVSATAVMHTALAAGVIPVEPMPAAIPGVPSPYHAVDFCVPVGPDFNLVTGLCVCSSILSR